MRLKQGHGCLNLVTTFTSPSISSDDSGNFVITWGDHRLGFNGDIFAQSYLSNGTATGDNFKVNDDEGSENQIRPSVAKDISDNFIIVWSDDRNGDVDIYAQRFSNDGTALCNNFKVNDDEGYDKNKEGEEVIVQ